MFRKVFGIYSVEEKVDSRSNLSRSRRRGGLYLFGYRRVWFSFFRFVVGICLGKVYVLFSRRYWRR